MKTIPESPALDLSGIAPASVEAAAESANLPAVHESPPSPSVPGVQGYDLEDFKWVPVLRKPRADGWTPQRQVDFIAGLADSGCVEQAARAVGMSVVSCYRLRRSPGAHAFAAAWEAAIAQAARRLVDIAFDRAIHGSDEPVFDRDGNRVGRRMRQNDRLLMFLLRAYMPDRFRHAQEGARRPSEPAPAAPHLLMPPEDLEHALECAEILDGELPHWHRYKCEQADPSVSPLGEEFERQLEEAKRAAEPHWSSKPAAAPAKRNKRALA